MSSPRTKKKTGSPKKVSSPRKGRKKVEDEKVTDGGGENKSAEEEQKPEDKDLVELDLYNSDDILRLDDIFASFQNALNVQKAKLTAKWMSNYTKRDPVNTNNTNSDSSNSSTPIGRSKKKLMIDVKSHLKHISKLGMLKVYKFEDLEDEQNKAIAKLEEVLKLEEEARVSRNKAIEIQQETELEMKEIEEQRAIIAHELAKAEPELKNARRAVSSISDAALNELVSLQKPPSVVANVLTVAVWIIHSKDEIKVAPKKIPKSPKETRSRPTTGSSYSHKKFFGSDALLSTKDLATSPKVGGNINSKKKNKGPKLTNSKSASRPRTATGPNRSATNRREKNKSRIKDKKKQVDILKQPWRDTRKLLSGSKFKKQVLEFDPKTLAKNVCDRIEKEFLIMEDFTIERANAASKVLGPLVQWIVSLVAYGKIWWKIRPLAVKVAELEVALAWKTEEVERLKQTSEIMHNKVIQIRGEILIMIGYKKVDQFYLM